MQLIPEMCKYICLMAIQLRMNTYRPNSKYCALCAHTNQRDSQQVRSFDKCFQCDICLRSSVTTTHPLKVVCCWLNQSICIVLQSTRLRKVRQSCVFSKLKQSTGNTLVGRDYKCKYGSDMDESVDLLSFSSALSKSASCPREGKPNAAMNVSYCSCSTCLQYEVSKKTRNALGICVFLTETGPCSLSPYRQDASRAEHRV